ncbi:MAG: hypothetical protein LBG52_04225 [Candidatus Peribacteria bacterium]|jgi:hypothetical protein|nr:hypothetical protein [Candidatus Peribacteria bacterium]
MRQLRIETHTKVQIVEYSLVSVGANTQAEIKKINNTAEIFKNNGLEDVELEQDEERKEEKKEEEEKENPETSEENLRKEGETPEASSNDTALTSENEEEAATPSTENEEGEAPATGGDVEPNAIKLKAQLLEVQAKLKVAEEYNERLEKEKAELETQLNYHNSKVIVKKTDLKENMVTPTEEDIAKVKSNLSRIYQRP